MRGEIAVVLGANLSRLAGDASERGLDMRTTGFPAQLARERRARLRAHARDRLEKRARSRHVTANEPHARRLLHLTVDGQERDVWVTSPTVAAALAQLGYSVADFSSVSRDKRLPLSPTAIEIRSPKQVTIIHDHKKQTVTTTDATVRQLLTDLRIKVDQDDRIRPTSTAVLKNGTQLKLSRSRRDQLEALIRYLS